MHRASGIGHSKEEALERALKALKDQLWEECWRDEIELTGVSHRVVHRDGGVFEVIVEL